MKMHGYGLAAVLALDTVMFGSVAGGLLDAGQLVALLGLAAYGGVAVWFGFASRQFQSLGGKSRIGPVWGAASFFIPIANFFVPYGFVSDVWKGTEERRDQSSLWLVRVWWAVWVGALLVARFVDLGAWHVLPRALSAALTTAVVLRVADRLTAFASR